MKILDIPRSGSMAGITSSRNRFGQYVRNRRSPVQPIGTGRRAFIRNAFGSASAAWAALTEEQQAAWDGFAESHPIVNSLGATVVLTGHQMFVAVGTQRQNIGIAIGTEVPTTTETATLTEAEFAITLPSTFNLTFTCDVADDFVLVAYSPMLSPGRRFPPRFWQDQAITTTAGSMSVGNMGNYQAEFGTVTAGVRIFAKLTPVNAEGWTGVPVILSAVVAPEPP